MVNVIYLVISYLPSKCGIVVHPTSLFTEMVIDYIVIVVINVCSEWSR